MTKSKFSPAVGTSTDQNSHDPTTPPTYGTVTPAKAKPRSGKNVDRTRANIDGSPKSQETLRREFLLSAKQYAHPNQAPDHIAALVAKYKKLGLKDTSLPTAPAISTAPAEPTMPVAPAAPLSDGANSWLKGGK